MYLITQKKAMKQIVSYTYFKYVIFIIILSQLTLFYYVYVIFLLVYDQLLFNMVAVWQKNICNKMY